MTAQPSPTIRFRRAIENRSVILAELAAGEMERVSLEDALALVYLYAEEGSPKYERAALRYLHRWISEAQPSLGDVAATACGFVEHSVRNG